MGTRKRFIFDEREFAKNTPNCEDCEHYDFENDVCLLDECCYLIKEKEQNEAE
jgi:hypothetical protein